ncbi:hypothetical protein EK599_10280 [Vibrio sp. T187]|uniref:hypothetical protein n=1 Tax=Vibrio TaxID=662 RepID=UPI0010CA1CA8|nr:MULTISPECIES: hypothetical protein [Vibrio]MBW3696085.1 hypothetical protein [Vibrio sp. T187]
MQKNKVFNRLNDIECPVDVKAKLLSVVQHMEKFGSVSELELCKIFGEVIWNDGKDYHSHAFSFRIDEEKRHCLISRFKYH